MVVLKTAKMVDLGTEFWGMAILGNGHCGKRPFWERLFWERSFGLEADAESKRFHLYYAESKRFHSPIFNEFQY